MPDPNETLYRTGLQIRAFIAFLYRLIPRLKSSSWKLAVRRPPAVSSDFAGSFIPAHAGFDQWKAITRANAHTSTILAEDQGRIGSFGPGWPVGVTYLEIRHAYTAVKIMSLF